MSLSIVKTICAHCGVPTVRVSISNQPSSGSNASKVVKYYLYEIYFGQRLTLNESITSL